ncbi:MAG: PrsW family glutamic-type intramembrane protease [Bacteroidales bacterium]|nr:PrsW family intramembrane metalloprotease [Paludibacteraceae bacterium]MDY6373760.1 PrsW family glutamic-type intramembrane protease [Bacteroidales bacterium]MDY6427816.1 PrsW family glutamic-type intramembrane protease [Bacteroidales bacterium]
MRYILLLAFIPIFVIAVYIYKRDKFNKEPLKELLKAFAAGMFSAVVVILVHEILDLSGVDIETNVFLRAFVSAAVIEECSKFFFFYKLFWNNPNFDERFDGIVYAVYVSLGFAFVENVLYIYQDVGQAVSIARARAFFAVPAHTLFAIAMGYGAGIARFSRKRASLYLVSGLIWAILLHGIYDFLLMYSNELASVNETFSAFIVMLFYIFVIIMWVVGFRRMKKLNEEDQWRL